MFEKVYRKKVIELTLQSTRTMKDFMTRQGQAILLIPLDSKIFIHITQSNKSI